MNSWLDLMPSSERQRVREKYKMSAAAYEQLREKVTGPEEMEREMRKNEQLASLKFALETEPTVKEALKKQIEKDLSEDSEGVLESSVSHEVLSSFLEEGFDVSIDSDSDKMVIHPEGNVTETVAISSHVRDAYASEM